MSSWKKAPVPEDMGEAHLEANLSTGAGYDWSQISVLGLDIPVDAIVLPLALFAFYQVFAGMRRGNDRRLRQPDAEAGDDLR